MSMQEQRRSSGDGIPQAGDSACPDGSENLLCPACGQRTVLRQVAAGLFASGLDEVIYGCEKCGTEVKRTIKRD